MKPAKRYHDLFKMDLSGGPLVPPQWANDENRQHRDVHRRVRRLRARHRRAARRAGGRSRPTRRHHVHDPASAGSTLGARPRRVRHRRRDRPSSPSASTSFPARTCTARWRASTPRCGTCAARSRARACASCSAARRSACAHTRRRCGATSRRATRRRVSLLCGIVTASTPSSSAWARSTATTWTNGRAAPRRSSPRSASALGRDAALLVDANSAFSPKRAIEVGRLLEEHGVEHFEEPCPYWEVEQTKAVRDALRARRDGRRAGLLPADCGST